MTMMTDMMLEMKIKIFWIKNDDKKEEVAIID